MDSNLKQFLESKKNLILDTKIPGIRKQKTEVPKPLKTMDKPIDSDPYRRMVNMIIKDKPSKQDVVDKFQQFITAAEAAL
jgi:hypothetical protein